ncbi:MAG: alpha/beta fold hydrolase, partial [Pseudomonadota bacterium]
MQTRAWWLSFAAWCWLAGPLLAQTAFPGSGPTPAAKTPRPLTQFAELPLLQGPKISPNGKLAATQLAVGGKQYLAIVPLDGGAPRLIAVGDLDLNWWRWVNDDWLVVGIGDRDSLPEIGDIYVRRAVGVGVTTKKLVPLATRDAAQNADDLIWVARDGTPRVLLAVQKSLFTDSPDFWPEVIEIDVSTGRSRRVMAPREEIFDWVADGDGTVRMGIGRSLDGRTLRAIYRDGPASPFRQIVRSTKVTDAIVLPALFLPEAGQALALADDENGLSAIFEFDVNELKLGKRRYASAGFDIAGYATTDDGKGLAGISYLDDAARREWIDPDLAAMQRDLAQSVQGGSARIVSYSADHKRAIVFVGAPSSPGAYYIYDRPSEDLRLMAMVNATIGAARLNPVRTIRYQARDGLEIAAVLTLPRLRAAKQLPLIVLPHGGPFARDSEEWDWWAQALAERGYAVVQPNYRGSSGYGTPFTKKGEGQWGLAMQDDLIDAIAHLGKQGIADPTRVCIAGASYGGYAAMRATQRDTAHYRCAISYAGVSDLGRMKRYDAQFLAAGVRADWMKRQANDFREVSPLTAPERTALPLLLMHGRKDTVVPVDQSRALANRLRQLGKPVTYIEQPLGDHHFSRGEDRLEFLSAMQAFLDRHNPADVPT